MFLITKKFKFDSAHYLLDYNGACENLHGHTYYMEVTFKGQKQTDGMVIDFTFIKNKINKLIIDKLDHNNINNILKHSTAENIAEWVWDNIIKNIDTKNAELFEIKLWEGPNSFVTYRGGNDF